jgi:hypothetical protein
LAVTIFGTIDIFRLLDALSLLLELTAKTGLLQTVVRYFWRKYIPSLFDNLN